MDLVESYRQDLRFARKTTTRALLFLLLAAVAVFPWVAPEYMVFLATLIALYSIGVIGQNLLIGYTGQISFAQAAFLAIGAFAFGHLRIWGAPFSPAPVGGGGLAAGPGGVGRFGGDTRFGNRRRGERRQPDALQAAGIRHFVLLHRRARRALRAGALPYRAADLQHPRVAHDVRRRGNRWHRLHRGFDPRRRVRHRCAEAVLGV